MNDKNYSKTKKLTLLAIFTAVVAACAFLRISIMGPGLTITVAMVPVAVGAICFGPAAGAYLGGVFGLVSFLQCLGMDAFGTALFGINPWLTLLVCLPTRILAGWLTGWIYRGSARILKKPLPSYLIAGCMAAVLNTVLFMTTLVVCFYQTELIQGYVELLGAANPFVFVILFVGVNAIAEIVAGAILAAPCAAAVDRSLRAEHA